MVFSEPMLVDDQLSRRSVSHLNDERAEVLRVSNTHRVGGRVVFGDLHLLRTVGSRPRPGLLGGVCTRMPHSYIKVIYLLLSVH
jgi:hypothetical protein